MVDIFQKSQYALSMFGPLPYAFRKAFEGNYSPRFAAQLVAVIEDGAKKATQLCEDNFPTGSYAQTQGNLRRQFICNDSQLTVFDGDVIAEVRDFDGFIRDGSERVNTFTMFTTKNARLIVLRTKPWGFKLSNSQIFSAMAAEAFRDYALPLFQSPDISKAEVSSGAKSLFVVRYSLDTSDPKRSLIGDIDVVVMDGRGDQVYCPVCDLREYSSRQIKDSQPWDDNVPLPIELLDIEIVPEENSFADELPISLTDLQLEDDSDQFGLFPSLDLWGEDNDETK